MIEESKRNPTDTVHPIKRVYGIVTRVFQVIYIIVTWLFALCVLIQAYFAGLGIFDNGGWLGVHSGLGWMLAMFSIFMLILLPLGRFPRKVVLLHLLLVVDVIFQVGLVSFLYAFHAPALTALHPVNALLLFIISALLGYSAFSWTRSTRQSRGD
ncbi:DUF6220 domain-containing protein [Ktedonobacter robiniae]|uniref:Cytochrome b561 domain-containing protein n=1 Tax=Ktedonobacter robiniae TaxID=2778365 RepID=A0ABQ3UT21_9CHLR|nr:DUF6220 domain-containing protein [Ktedonobacter robiniae]GHO55884.1 hypothetical protein KSB_43590 [Ktedonobacter robiniae]